MSPCRAKDFLRVMMIPSRNSTSACIVSNLAAVAQGGVWLFWRSSSVVVAHNHPSGDPTPSEDDIALTKDLIEIGRLHKIPVIDHLVLAKRGADAGTFVSIRNLAILSFG